MLRLGIIPFYFNYETFTIALHNEGSSEKRVFPFSGDH